MVTEFSFFGRTIPFSRIYLKCVFKNYNIIINDLFSQLLYTFYAGKDYLK